MNQTLIRERKDLLCLCLIGIAAVLLVVCVGRLAVFAVEAQGDPNLVEDLIAKNKPDAERLKQYRADYLERIETLKKKNLLAPPPPEPEPPKQCTAILGNEALIEGKWIKVGDTVKAGAKVVKIEPTQVTLDWKGKKIHLAPIKAVTAGPAGPARPQPVKVEKPVEKKVTTAVQPVEVTPSESEPVVEETATEEDPLAWMGVKIPDSVREKFLQMWNSMTDEQKEQAKEQWSKMSDEQKQQAVDQMSQHL